MLKVKKIYIYGTVTAHDLIFMFREIRETFGKKSVSRLCENPLVKFTVKNSHSNLNHRTEHIIQPTRVLIAPTLLYNN